MFIFKISFKLKGMQSYTDQLPCDYEPNGFPFGS